MSLLTPQQPPLSSAVRHKEVGGGSCLGYRAWPGAPCLSLRNTSSLRGKANQYKHTLQDNVGQLGEKDKKAQEDDGSATTNKGKFEGHPLCGNLV
eukprot:m.335181 g.335181  ORF g.335181 m.335181 type:complete len:95 (+) comp19791_c0_seq3:82-366(+)